MSGGVRLAEYVPAERNRGICSKHGTDWQRPCLKKVHRCARLGASQPHNVLSGIFRGGGRLIDLYCSIRRFEQIVETYADALQKFFPPRAARRQVNGIIDRAHLTRTSESLASLATGARLPSSG